MKFGVREICDVVFKANQSGKLGGMDVKKGQPVLYIDSAKTSTIEGAATTVYATGGKGNSRLIAWEGEKTLTFTVEDALLSPIGFAMLSGAGLFEAGKDGNGDAYVHTTAVASVGANKIVELDLDGDVISADAPIFVMPYVDGSIDAANILSISGEVGANSFTLAGNTPSTVSQVFVDFYVKKASAVTELQIDAENFAGFYYVEASTLFRRESDGKDLPAEIVFPKVKIQSNFTFTMASSGDPSTFTFTMDAFPAYTMFKKDKKVLCAIQVIDDSIKSEVSVPVTMNANNYADTEVLAEDSNSTKPTYYTVTYKVGEVIVGTDKVLKNETTSAPAGVAVTTWYNGAEEYDFDTAVTEDLTLTNTAVGA